MICLTIRVSDGRQPPLPLRMQSGSNCCLPLARTLWLASWVSGCICFQPANSIGRHLERVRFDDLAWDGVHLLEGVAPFEGCVQGVREPSDHSEINYRDSGEYGRNRSEPPP